MTYIEAVVVPILVVGLIVGVIAGNSHKARPRAQTASQTVPAADTVSPAPPRFRTDVVRVIDPEYGVICWVAKGTGIYCMRTP